MRPFVVVFLLKAPEPSLLLVNVRGWRARGFRFERPVHPFVRPILLRVPAFNALDLNPKRIHHTLSGDNPATPGPANGVPLSDRIRSGNPYLSKVRRNAVRVAASVGPKCPWQVSRYRLNASIIVSG